MTLGKTSKRLERLFCHFHVNKKCGSYLYSGGRITSSNQKQLGAIEIKLVAYVNNSVNFIEIEYRLNGSSVISSIHYTFVYRYGLRV